MTQAIPAPATMKSAWPKKGDVTSDLLLITSIDNMLLLIRVLWTSYIDFQFITSYRGCSKYAANECIYRSGERRFLLLVVPTTTHSIDTMFTGTRVLCQRICGSVACYTVSSRSRLVQHRTNRDLLYPHGLHPCAEQQWYGSPEPDGLPLKAPGRWC